MNDLRVLELFDIQSRTMFILICTIILFFQSFMFNTFERSVSQ